MQQPPLFREERVEVLHALIRAHPFATLVSLNDGDLTGDHVPLVLDADRGTLCGHLARANPLVRRETDTPIPVLAIFHGPQAYVSPGWYPSKAATGEAVPTWNYIAVHAHGTLSVSRDPEWTLDHLAQLSSQFEAHRPDPWSPYDAPRDYIDRQLRALTGFEIQIERLQGTWKLSQNRAPQDRDGVIAGLSAEPDPMARAIAHQVAVRAR